MVGGVKGVGTTMRFDDDDESSATKEERERARKRILKATKRGAFTGLTLKGGVNAFGVLSRFLRGKTRCGTVESERGGGGRGEV